MRWLSFFLVIGFVGSSWVACVTTPESKRRQLNFIPDSQMNALGVQAYQEVLATEKPLKGPLADRIVAIGKRIAAASGARFDWEFVVLDNKEVVNAFCLPGGKIAVYTGIIPVAANDAGLAAVLGHEVAHATLKHGAERMSQALVVNLGIEAASISLKNNKQRDLILGAMGVGAQFGIMLPYGRSHESEADKIGLKYMAKAGFDPKEAIFLWERMAKLSGSRPPEILSTHPDPENRARELEKEQPKVAPEYAQSTKQPTLPLAL